MANKDIEIPFGAYDSELGGFEYTIPEGYKAEIKDGKVVVRKTESEDERIRKEMIFYFQEEIPQCSIQEHADKMKEFIAWLEKQGKQKDILEDAILDSNKDGLIADTIRYKREKQGEQKPAWSEDDERIRQDIENLIYFALNDGSAVSPAANTTKEDAISWIQSLKDRIPSKQEWNEEDERMLNEVILGLKVLKYKDSGEEEKAAYQREIDWLESLKPQNTWKPSDEQMKIFNEVLNFAANHENPHWNDYIFGTLHNLIIQLKKLREE